MVLGYKTSMRALIASLVILAFAITGSANCALAQGHEGVRTAASQAAPASVPPCHEPAADAAQAGHGALHIDDDCSGGAACVDCALAAGLSVDPAFLGGLALQGAPQLFTVKTARTGLFTHDPPPPRT
jgi:hypothetical protein